MNVSLSWPRCVLYCSVRVSVAHGIFEAIAVDLYAGLHKGKELSSSFPNNKFVGQVSELTALIAAGASKKERSVMSKMLFRMESLQVQDIL